MHGVCGIYVIHFVYCPTKFIIMKRDVKVSARVSNDLVRKIEECRSSDPPPGFEGRKQKSTADIFEIAVDFLHAFLFANRK